MYFSGVVSNISGHTAKTAGESLPIWSCYQKTNTLKEYNRTKISVGLTTSALCIHPTAPPMSDEGSVASRDELVEEDYEEEDDASVDDMSHDARSKTAKMQMTSIMRKKKQETYSTTTPLSCSTVRIANTAFRRRLFYKAKANMVVGTASKWENSFAPSLSQSGVLC